MRARKLTGLLLALCIAAGLCAVALATPAEAYNVATYGSTKLTVGVKVADVKYAGTDSSIYLKAYYTDNSNKEEKLDTKYNDFERNSYRDYEVWLDKPAWMIKRLEIRNSGGDAMCISYVHYKVEFGYTKVYDIWDGTANSPINVWVDKSSRGKDTGVLKRDANPNKWIKARSTVYLSFNQAFGGDSFLDGTGSTESHQWGGVLYDQYDSAYDMYLAPAAGKLSYTISGVGTNGTTNTNSFNDLITPLKVKNSYDNNEYIYGYSFDRSDVYALMTKLGMNKLTITESLQLDKNTCTGTLTYTKDYTLRTKTIGLGTPTISSNYYTEDTDRYYFNNKYRQVTVYVPILTGGNHDNYNARDVLNHMKYDAKLFYGEGAEEYVTPAVRAIDPETNSMKLIFEFRGTSYDNPEGKVSLKLELKNLRSEFMAYNNWTTYTWEGGADFEYYFSQFKYDSQAPALSVEAKDGKAISDAKEAVWRQFLPVVTTVTNSNTTYPVTNENGKVGPSNIDTYEMWLEEGGRRVLLQTASGATKDTFSVPNISGQETDLRLAAHTEGKDYMLVVHGYDAAANEFRYQYEGICLDNQAPRVTLTEKPQGIAGDGSKSIYYAFSIQDLSGTGKVHYCFLEKGKTLPSEHGEGKPGGMIESTLNEWAYVEQSELTGSTIVLKMEKGKQFSGTLYYYTTDDCGNDSRYENNPVKAEYFTKNVFLDNAAAECEVHIAQYDYPLSDYSNYISFTPGDNCTVYYRYRGTGGQYTKYVPGVSKPGSALQAGVYGLTETYLNSAEWKSLSAEEQRAYMLKGNQVLEYKVVNDTSLNTRYFEGDNGIALYFDNYDSKIELLQESKALSPLAQSFTVRASDDSGIASGTYTVKVAGGAAVKTGTLDVANNRVNEKLSLTELGNGCYTLTVEVTDRNGNVTERTTDAFTVRSEVPEVTAAIVTEDGTQQEDGSWLMTGYDYQLKLEVREAYSGTEAAGTQKLMYRVSADGGRYSDWMEAGVLAEGGGGFTLKTELDNPVALTERVNRVYLQLICADEARSLSGLNSGNAAILTLEPYLFHVDSEAPTYDLEMMTFERTNEAVTAYLHLYDNDAGALTLGWKKGENDAADAVTWATEIQVPKAAAEETAETTGEETEEISGTLTETETVKLDENVYFVSFRTNQAVLTVTDAAGNETEINFKTDLYDVTPPVITFDYDTEKVSEERTDGIIYIRVENADSALTEIHPTYGTSVSGSHFTLTQTGSVLNTDGTSTSEYTAVIKGLSGSFGISVTAVDDVGNKSEAASDPVSVAYPAAITIDTEKSTDQEKAQDSARSKIAFNVPVYVLPTGLMTGTAETGYEKDEETAALQARNGNTDMEQKVTLNADTPGTHRFTLVAADEFGNTAVIPYDCSTVFGDGYEIQYKLEQYYITDVPGTSDVAWTLLSDSPQADGNYLVGHQGEEWSNPTYATVLTVTAADTEEPLAFRVEGYSYSGGVEESGWESDYFWASIPEWESDSTPTGTLCEGYDTGYYTTAVFYMDSCTSPDGYEKTKQLVVECCPVSALSDPEHVYQTNVLTFDNIVNAEPCVTVSMTPVDRPAKEVQVTLTPASVDDKLALDENGAPLPNVYLDEHGDPVQATDGSLLRKPVEVTRIILFRGWEEVEIAGETVWQKAVVASWEKPDPNDPDYDPETAASCLTYTITKNGTYSIEVENEYGIIGYCAVDVPEELLEESGNVSYLEDYGGEGADLIIGNIHNDPLDEYDFAVTYQLLPDEKEVDPADGIYANRVRAVITEVPESEQPPKSERENAEPAAEASEESEAYVEKEAPDEPRNLYARNNNGSLEVELTPNRSVFTFLLADRYGYTIEQEVRYDWFDTAAPTVRYELNNFDENGDPVNAENTGDPNTLAKTCHGVLLYVDADDADSGVAELTVTKGGKAAVWDDVQGAFLLTENGSYSITATDRSGNRRTKNVTVSNIDSVLPVMYVTYSHDPVYSSVAKNYTQENITATFRFSKPNVTVTKVEPGDKTGEDDYTYSKTNNSITFTKNGNVLVSYRDEAGNEVIQDLISVGTIYREKPQLEYQVRLSDDELSVEVTFALETDAEGVPLDPVRKLQDLSVRCGGVIQPAAVQVETADPLDETKTVKIWTPSVFRLTENGWYSFEISDAYGLTQELKYEVTGIDTAAPKVTAVSWTYLDENGEELSITGSPENLTGAGWRVTTSAQTPRTKYPVAVTVETDAKTGYVGGNAEYAQEHRLVYRENGMYIFNLIKKNGLTVSYGVDIEVIDTVPPVITKADGSELGELVFVEGTQGYSKALLEDCIATDTFGNVVTQVEVTIDYGTFNPDSLESNKFDKSKPYYIVYHAEDEAGNVMEVSRKITLIAFDDVLVTVNGVLPDSSGYFSDQTGNVRLDLLNYAGGQAYAKHMTGKYTLGQMKTRGEQLTAAADGSFSMTGLTDGWHTFYIQTATRDYFLICVYVSK